MPDRKVPVRNRIKQIRHDCATPFRRGGPYPQPFSLRDVAERVGVSYTTLSRWESGVALPSRPHRRALARVLGCTIAELAIEDPSPPRDQGPDTDAWLGEGNN